MTTKLRNAMVDLLRDRGQIHSPEVARAMRTVPRHLYVPDAPVEQAYSPFEGVVTHRDGNGVGISSASAPGLVAAMLEQLDVLPGHRVLEIGAGTGYNASLLAELVGQEGRVTTVDIDQDVVSHAQDCVAAAGYSHVSVFCADGAFGCTADAPYDRIIVTGGAWDVPPAWAEQLAPGGRLVVPLRIRGVTRTAALEPEDGYWRSRGPLNECGFIPLRGVTEVAENNVFVRDRAVTMRFDDGFSMEPDVLERAFGFVPLVRWSDVAGVAEDLDFWLASLPGFGRMIVTAADVFDVAPMHRWGSMAVVDAATAAYLTVDDPTSRSPELGVCAYGPAADALADKVVERIQDWDRGRSTRQLWIEVHPVESDTVPSGHLAVRKKHTKVVVRIKSGEDA